MTSGCPQVIRTCETELLSLLKLLVSQNSCFQLHRTKRGITQERWVEWKKQKNLVISKNSVRAWYNKLHFHILRRMTGLCRDGHKSWHWLICMVHVSYQTPSPKLTVNYTKWMYLQANATNNSTASDAIIIITLHVQPYFRFPLLLLWKLFY